MRSWKSWLPGAMKPALTVGSHSKSLAYDPVFEPMLAFMNRCNHFVIQKIALPCLDKKLEISSLAALVGYSDYYLTEKFKKETGQSIHQYIKKARINRAKMLLLSTNQSIQQIADHLAFATPNYFIRCFREEEGVTPAQFRKQK